MAEVTAEHGVAIGNIKTIPKTFTEIQQRERTRAVPIPRRLVRWGGSPRTRNRVCRKGWRLSNTNPFRKKKKKKKTNEKKRVAGTKG